MPPALEPHHVAREKGFPVELYLDAKEHRYVEEFGTSNFIAIAPDGTYVSAQSSSILASITNNGLQQVAADLGAPASRSARSSSPSCPSFAEVAACGTAVVITPVNEIVRGDEVIRVGAAGRLRPRLRVDLQPLPRHPGRRRGRPLWLDCLPCDFPGLGPQYE